MMGWLDRTGVVLLALAAGLLAGTVDTREVGIGLPLALAAGCAVLAMALLFVAGRASASDEKALK